MPIEQWIVIAIIVGMPTTAFVWAKIKSYKQSKVSKPILRITYPIKGKGLYNAWKRFISE